MKSFLLRLKTFGARLWKWARGHRLVAGLIAIAVVGGSCLLLSKLATGPSEARYVFATVEKGTLVTSVTGTGQVSVVNQREVKPKVSGDVTYVAVKNGQSVWAGQLLVQLDTTDAQRAVDDATIDLEQAQLTLQKMEGLTTAVGSIQSSEEKAATTLAQSYESGFNAVSSAFLTLPDVMTGLNTVLHGTALGTSGQQNVDYYVNMVDSIEQKENSVAHAYGENAEAAYDTARTSYDANFTNYKATSRDADNAAIKTLIGETYATTKLIANAVKSATNLIQYYKDERTEANKNIVAAADTHLTQLNSYTSQTNSLLSNLLSAKNTIQNSEESLVNVGFDVADQRIAVAKAARALEDAETNLAYCSVRAPFAGIVAAVSVKRGDSASAGTAVATVITQQRTAEVTLNEVDVANVKVGEKATITFDAIADLSISGEVSDVDTLGTASQGVVNYTVVISFDTQDARVKPGMSVSAAIITDVRQDVLLVPNGAVKEQGDIFYVEVFEPPLTAGNVVAGQGTFSAALPIRKIVEIGVSNDTMTEIASGLTEGAQVITQTVTSAAKSTPQSSVRNIGGGGMMMIGGPR